MKKIMLKLLTLLLLINITLFAGSMNEQPSTTPYITQSSSVEASTSAVQEVSEISLDLFGGSSMIIMVILSSLLGMFFVKDEFASVLE